MGASNNFEAKDLASKGGSTRFAPLAIPAPAKVLRIARNECVLRGAWRTPLATSLGAAPYDGLIAAPEMKR